MNSTVALTRVRSAWAKLRGLVYMTRIATVSLFRFGHLGGLPRSVGRVATMRASPRILGSGFVPGPLTLRRSKRICGEGSVGEYERISHRVCGDDVLV
jgi:hypothetical protein